MDAQDAAAAAAAASAETWSWPTGCSYQTLRINRNSGNTAASVKKEASATCRVLERRRLTLVGGVRRGRFIGSGGLRGLSTLHKQK